MTDDKKPDVTPHGNAPSWVDEVLSSSRAAPASTPSSPPPSPTGTPLSGPGDLKLPEPQSRPAADDD